VSSPSEAEREAARLAAEVARRAIRRLDVFEWVVFAAAFATAVLGGAGVAWLVAPREGPHFRITWTIASLLLFVIPGAIVIFQNRRTERASARPDTGRREEDDG
jgi:hypothetical protein